ncbi:MAG: HAD family phosphatase [Lentisphaeria bacterium]
MMEKVSYILDLDGTLINSEPIWLESFVYALGLRGITINSEDFLEFGFGCSWLEVFAEINKRWPGAYKTRFDMQKITEPYYSRVCQTRDITMPGARPLLKRLGEAGYPMTIVSGSTRPQIARAIRLLEAEKYITAFVGCEDVQRGKPDPEGFLKGAALLGKKPEDCIVVEDKEVGLQAAVNAGMRCVVLQLPQNPKQNLADASRIISSLDEF